MAQIRTRQRVYSGRVLSLDVDEIEEPGGIRATREVVRHPGSVVILAVDEQQRVALIRQYRYPVDDTIWEIPAGRQETGESPEEGARRELEEEVGARAASLERVLTFYATPGYCDEVMHLFRATGLTLVPARPEADEHIEARWISLDEARAMADRGEVRDAKTLLALLLEEARRRKGSEWLPHRQPDEEGQRGPEQQGRQRAQHVVHADAALEVAREGRGHRLAQATRDPDVVHPCVHGLQRDEQEGGQAQLEVEPAALTERPAQGAHQQEAREKRRPQRRVLEQDHAAHGAARPQLVLRTPGTP